MKPENELAIFESLVRYNVAAMNSFNQDRIVILQQVL